jgi:hypothetical protein
MLHTLSRLPILAVMIWCADASINAARGAKSTNCTATRLYKSIADGMRERPAGGVENQTGMPCRLCSNMTGIRSKWQRASRLVP